MGFIDEQREGTAMLVTALVLIGLTVGGIVASFINVTQALLGS